MQFPQDFGPATVVGKALFELAEELKKLGVGGFVFPISGTAQPGHATFFVVEMHRGVILHEVNEIKNELRSSRLGLVV